MGIPAHVVVDRRKKFTPAAVHDYECRRAIVVTAYSRLFHANALPKDAGKAVNPLVLPFETFALAA